MSGQAIRQPVMSRSRRFGFGTLLVTAMGAATFAITLVGLLASSFIDEFGMSRGDVGTVVGVVTLTGALLSPSVGRLTDRLGDVRALVALFVFAAAGFTGTGLANGFAALVAAAFLSGVANALGNPATNKAIALNVAPGRRGMITGLKQSGVQAAIFLGGLTVPALTDAVGWRATLFGLAVLCALFVPGVFAVVPSRDAVGPVAVDGAKDRVPPVMWWVAVYGFLLGASVGATVFVPLFVEEALGMSLAAGGVAVAINGSVATVGRIGWAEYAERSGRHLHALTLIAIGSVAGSGAMWLAPHAGTIWLWVGSAVIGLTSSSWNSVGMLAVIDLSPPGVAGRASGRVLLGFLLGLAAGPRVYGEIVDVTGSYDLMWAVSVALAAAGVGLTWLWRMTAHRN